MAGDIARVEVDWTNPYGGTFKVHFDGVTRFTPSGFSPMTSFVLPPGWANDLFSGVFPTYSATILPHSSVFASFVAMPGALTELRPAKVAISEAAADEYGPVGLPFVFRVYDEDNVRINTDSFDAGLLFFTEPTLGPPPPAPPFWTGFKKTYEVS
jgi:hypothetical protein